MKTESENFSPQESLDLITSMINRAKGNVQKNSFYFLLWGWTIMVCNLGIYIMIRFLEMHDPFWIWLLTVPAALVSGLYGRKQEQSRTTSHLDNINKWLWIGFGVICFTIVIFGFKINYQINPVIICMSAVPTFVSGIMLKFKPLIIGGLLFWISGIILFMLPMEEQFLAAALAIASGYLVPGYLLKAKNS